MGIAWVFYTGSFRLDVVRAVLTEAGVVGRERKSSMLTGVYFVLALTLFPEVGMVGVFGKLIGVFGWAGGGLPGAAALRERRVALGSPVFAKLFDRVRGVMDGAGTRWRGLLVAAWDGTGFDVPASQANWDHCGWTGNQRGRAGFPQVRLVALVACGARVLVDAVFGPQSDSEQKLTARLLGSLRSGMVLLADRNFSGYLLWVDTQATGAALLWRMKRGFVLAAHEVLPDGSYLAWRHKPRSLSREALAGRPAKVLVRVMEAVVAIVGEDGVTRREPYLFFTTLLDPVAFPAAELVALYAERWEMEIVFNGLKSTQRGDRRILRSKTVDGVDQEVWAYLIIHQLMRRFAAHTARVAGIDSDRISFKAVVQHLRDAIVRTAATPRRQSRTRTHAPRHPERSRP
jgi:Transposase DDE domain/Insertion element 4 transposase N-terminal